MISSEDPVRTLDRRRRHGAWAVILAVIALMLFTWPFVRSPRLDIGRSYAHLLGAWAAVVVALALLGRAIRRDDAGGAADG
jgi:drug/metabolite transporter superfamily protein YnfA